MLLGIYGFFKHFDFNLIVPLAGFIMDFGITLFITFILAVIFDPKKAKEKYKPTVYDCNNYIKTEVMCKTRPKGVIEFVDKNTSTDPYMVNWIGRIAGTASRENYPINNDQADKFYLALKKHVMTKSYIRFVLTDF